MRSFHVFLLLSIASLQLHAWNLRSFDQPVADEKLFVQEEINKEWAHVQNIYEMQGIMSELSSTAIKDKTNSLEPLTQLELMTRAPENHKPACVKVCGRYMNEDSRLPNYNWLHTTTNNKSHPICSSLGMICLPEKTIDPEICVCSRYLTPKALDCESPKGVLFDSLERCKEMSKNFEGECIELADEHLTCFKADPQVIRFAKWDTQARSCGNVTCAQTQEAALHLCGTPTELGEINFFICNSLGNPFPNITDFHLHDIKYRVINGKVYKHDNIISVNSAVNFRLVTKDKDSEYEIKIKSLLPLDPTVKAAADKMVPKSIFDMTKLEQVLVYTFAFFGVYMSCMIIGRWILMTFFGVSIPISMRSAFSSVLAALMFSVTGALKVTHEVAHLNFAIMLFVSFMVMLYGMANIFFLEKEEAVEYEPVPQYEGKIERKRKDRRAH